MESLRNIQWSYRVMTSKRNLAVCLDAGGIPEDAAYTICGISKTEMYVDDISIHSMRDYSTLMRGLFQDLFINVTVIVQYSSSISFHSFFIQFVFNRVNASVGILRVIYIVGFPLSFLLPPSISGVKCSNQTRHHFFSHKNPLTIMMKDDKHII